MIVASLRRKIRWKVLPGLPRTKIALCSQLFPQWHGSLWSPCRGVKVPEVCLLVNWLGQIHGYREASGSPRSQPDGHASPRNVSAPSSRAVKLSSECLASSVLRGSLADMAGVVVAVGENCNLMCCSKVRCHACMTAASCTMCRG